MIRRQIQKYADVRTKRFYQFELKATELCDCDRLVRCFLHNLNQRRADVAREKREKTGIPENVVNERSCRRLSVRTGNADQPAIQKSIGEFNLTPDYDSARPQ